LTPHWNEIYFATSTNHYAGGGGWGGAGVLLSWNLMHSSFHLLKSEAAKSPFLLMNIEDSEQYFCGSDFLLVASHWFNQNYIRFIELVEDESLIISR